MLEVGLTTLVPLTATVPTPLLIVTVVALLLVQESVELCPEVIDPGLAENERFGSGAAETFTVTEFDLVPPLPVQVKV